MYITFGQLYNFGETVSIVFWTDTWRPESFYDKIKKNRDLGMHTLCLLGESYSFISFSNQPSSDAVSILGVK